MTDPKILRAVQTTVGAGTAELVDHWIGLTPAGDLLVRDVWEVRVGVEGLALAARVMTFPNPTPEQLATAVETDVTRALRA